jgi:hypothetical protein
MLVHVSPYLVFSPSYVHIPFYLVHLDPYACYFVSLLIVGVPLSDAWQGHQPKPRRVQDGAQMRGDDDGVF